MRVSPNEQNQLNLKLFLRLPAASAVAKRSSVIVATRTCRIGPEKQGVCPPIFHGFSMSALSPMRVLRRSDSGNVVCPDIAIQPSRDLPQTPWSSQVLSSASRTLSHSGTAEAFKTTFEVFPRVGPDNSLEGLTERSVGLIAHRPGNVDELFVALFK